MNTKGSSDVAGRGIGPASGIGGGLGLVAALLLGVEVPLGLIAGAAVGVLVGLMLDGRLSSRWHR